MKTDFDTIYDLCAYYHRTMKPNENLSLTINVRQVPMTFHIYRLPDEFIFDSSTTVANVFSLCKTVDTATQLILGNNITVKNGVTLTPPYRCKGMIIYNIGTLRNLGTISMYARGCIATGQNIYLYENDYVPALGGTGGTAPVTSTLYNDGGNCLNGNAGANGSNRASGGGGSGSIRNYIARMYAGRGGHGTSYSGGAGGGAACTDRASSRTAGSGADNGGAGGHGAQGGNTTGNSGGSTNGWGMVAGGGQGNGPGNNVWCGHVSASVPSGQPVGTGGLLIIYCLILDNQGNINANGVTARYTTVSKSERGWHNLSGGSSGGGSLNVYYCELINYGTIQSNGGAAQWTGMNWAGGKGGNGCVTVKRLINIQIRKNSNFYKDSIPQNIFEFNNIFGGA